MRTRHAIAHCLLYVVLFSMPSAARAEEPFGQKFTYNIRGLLYGEAQHPAVSTQNPDNAFLHRYRFAGTFELRPDLFFDGSAVNAMFKPRLTSSARWWEDGVAKGEQDTLTRAFVNEWRVQAKPGSSFLVSFGKEKLLWGPSFLASPSNILFKDTEKLNPVREVEGNYMARALYAPDAALTLNAVAGTQKDDDPAAANGHPIRALKADWVGASASLSVIGYFRQDDRFRFGSYGQWTTTDALLLYYDGIMMQGTDALYPVTDPSHPFGGTFARTYQDSGQLFATAVAGGAYTFLAGPTLSLEFLYNGQGYGDADAQAYYRIRGQASSHYFDSGSLSALSRRTLGQTIDTGLPFLRRYYMMGQLQVREIGNVLDVSVRYVHGLDEHAGQASTIIEWRVSDRVQFFNVNALAVDGGKETEFNAVLERSFLAGLEYHF